MAEPDFTPIRAARLTAFAALTAITTLAASATTTTAQVPVGPIPVVVGGFQAPACGTGLVQGLDPFGDGFLAVRTGPSSDNNQIDSLYNGMQINVCRELGNWLAIVYDPRGQLSERCNVSHPWPTAMPYTGPCRSGWVYRQWVGPLERSAGGGQPQ
jgi:hypothetical protein